jgi:hypothetical protein
MRSMSPFRGGRDWLYVTMRLRRDLAGSNLLYK